MTDSHVTLSPNGGAMFAGSDGVRLYTAIALKTALNSYARCGLRMNRTWTPTAMLAKAGEICGKKYKRGEYQAAAADLDKWILAMQSALPIEVRS